ncbi:hypothetical protein EV182_000851 [Spiromyces aspiralis]|uniref:Uncharacterized protein n=1 Tax=Spiromyces aspiralis TaxID=68401 RepID=A0ACC1HIT5_9FUNG|nr:hypothetical protein EV182_000851 [Spiromyces aspiralis]
MPETMQPQYDIDRLGTLKRSRLQKLCKRFDLKATGKNIELVERLIEYYEQHQGNGEDDQKREDGPRHPTPKDTDEESKGEGTRAQLDTTDAGHTDSSDEVVPVSGSNAYNGNGSNRDDITVAESESRQAKSNADPIMSAPIPSSAQHNQGPKDCSTLESAVSIPASLAAIVQGAREPQEHGSTKSVTNSEFKSLASNIIAELESRTISMSNTERKELSEGWLKKNGAISTSKDQPVKMTGTSRRYDSAHEELFSKSDSIANHWAALRNPSRNPEKRRLAGTAGELSKSKAEDTIATPSKRQKVNNPCAQRDSIRSPVPHYMTPRGRASATASSNSKQERLIRMARRTPLFRRQPTGPASSTTGTINNPLAAATAAKKKRVLHNLTRPAPVKQAPPSPSSIAAKLSASTTDNPPQLMGSVKHSPAAVTPTRGTMQPQFSEPLSHGKPAGGRLPLPRLTRATMLFAASREKAVSAGNTPNNSSNAGGLGATLPPSLPRPKSSLPLSSNCEGTSTTESGVTSTTTTSNNPSPSVTKRPATPTLMVNSSSFPSYMRPTAASQRLWRTQPSEAHKSKASSQISPKRPTIGRPRAEPSKR